MNSSEPLFAMSILAYTGLFLATLALIHDYVKNHPELLDEDDSKKI